ncbi:MAG: protoporphyrinogen/coproporphyrinogen oxidase [Pirellulaceae bacterium]
MTPKPPVVILGAGLAGLTAATYLRRHKVPIRVFEAGKTIAGLCQSEKDEEGFTYDCGAHFITNRLAAAVGISTECRKMPRYGETVIYRGRSYSYPLGLLRSARFVSSALAAKFSSPFRKKPKSAAEHYQSQYGRVLANEIAVPLTEAWSGASGAELSAAVGEKFANSLLWTLVLRMAGHFTARTVAIGYSGTVAESPHVWHVYPSGGISAVCEKLAGEVREEIATESKVEAILVENERVVGVQVNGKEVPASAVISTAPVHVLPKLIRGSNRLEYLSKFRYRGMVFINLKIEGASGLPDVVTWTPGDDFPFFRLSDIGLGLPWLVPHGKSQVTCDIGCQVGDETWKASDEELARLCTAALEKIVPFIGKRVFGSRVVRVPLAYPVYKTEYEEDRRRFEQGTEIGGLLSVGRNGEFAHILMEDVYWRTRWQIAKFLKDQLGLARSPSLMAL